MRELARVLLVMVLCTSAVMAQTLEEQVQKQENEIKRLKRELSVKEQEIKILLITLKNAQQEAVLNSDGTKLEFKDVNQLSATRVVVKPSMLSEAAIKEIDQGSYTDTDTMSANMAQSVKEQDVSVEVEGKEKEALKESATESTLKEAPKRQDGPKVIAKLTYMKPSKFELTADAQIFAKIYGNAIETWEQGQRFTSNKRRGPWIQITGKITAKGWEQVKKPLWIDDQYTKIVK